QKQICEKRNRKTTHEKIQFPQLPPVRRSIQSSKFNSSTFPLPPTSTFDVRCWMFDVPFPLRRLPGTHLLISHRRTLHPQLPPRKHVHPIPVPRDSHQRCPPCGVARLSKRLHPGPQHSDRSRRQSRRPIHKIIVLA